MCLFLSMVTKLQKYRVIIGVWGNGEPWSRRPCLALYWYGPGCNLPVTREKIPPAASGEVREEDPYYSAELMNRTNYALLTEG